MNPPYFLRTYIFHKNSFLIFKNPSKFRNKIKTNLFRMVQNLTDMCIDKFLEPWLFKLASTDRQVCQYASNLCAAATCATFLLLQATHNLSI